MRVRYRGWAGSGCLRLPGPPCPCPRMDRKIPSMLRRAKKAAPQGIAGRARVGKRTKDLIKRLEPGEIAVIDHADLDRVAADGLVGRRRGGGRQRAAVDHRPLPERRAPAHRARPASRSSTTSDPSCSTPLEGRSARSPWPTGTSVPAASSSATGNRRTRRGPRDAHGRGQAHASAPSSSASPRTRSSTSAGRRELTFDAADAAAAAHQDRRPPRARRGAGPRLQATTSRALRPLHPRVPAGAHRRRRRRRRPARASG